MKIAIYGVSRAGKDYFIGKAREIGRASCRERV